ncbi:MAG: tRNA epoxyqueuosine(34) reductase QueG [Acidobacteria bacterium]|nr:tRNA epoxyqueuosine(34) reductase QueG [Acidobacteriota bacterium]
MPIEPAEQEAPGPEPLPSGPRGWISRYAWGNDYHEVLRSKLDALVAAMHAKIAEPFEARAYVDTGPIVERVAASYAGLGWLAKNTCLINPQLGSWLFLGVILTTLELAPSLGAAEAPPPDLCGNCRLCLDACPTGAIVEPYLLDARRCISYLTIELRGAIPDEFRAPMGRHVFGCDICQDVCPWNRAAPQTSVSAFLPRQLKTSEIPRSLGSLGMTGSGGRHSEPAGVIPSPPRNPSGAQDEPGGGLPSLKRQFTRAPEDNPPVESDVVSLFAPRLEWLASLSEEEYREVFRGSALKRAKWHGLVRNACVALGNCGARPGTAQHTRIAALLERLAASDDALIAEHAKWASRKL